MVWFVLNQEVVQNQISLKAISTAGYLLYQQGIFLRHAMYVLSRYHMCQYQARTLGFG